MIDIVCAFCQNPGDRVLYQATVHEQDVTAKRFSGRKKPDRMHYRIVLCTKCDLTFSSPIFPSNRIIQYYKYSSYGKKDHLPYLAQTYLDLFHHLKKYLPKNPRILDIGCGTGFFMHALYTHGFTRIAGVEPSTIEVAGANRLIRKKICNDVMRPGLFPPQSFDVICAFHVLDHVSDIHTFCKTVATMLKPGGFFLCVVHDTEGLSVKLFGERSPIFDIQHITLFNRRTLPRLLQMHGMHIIELFSLKNTFPLEFWLSMSGLPQVVERIARGIAKLCTINRKAITLAAGNIAAIAQKN